MAPFPSPESRYELGRNLGFLLVGMRRRVLDRGAVPRFAAGGSVRRFGACGPVVQMSACLRFRAMCQWLRARNLAELEGRRYQPIEFRGWVRRVVGGSA